MRKKTRSGSCSSVMRGDIMQKIFFPPRWRGGHFSKKYRGFYLFIYLNCYYVDKYGDLDVHSVYRSSLMREFVHNS